MEYRLMRLRKYYDALRTNKPFVATTPMQKYKISKNIMRFYNNIRSKPLVINNKPVTAQIEPTSECNLRCGMCIRDKVGVPIGTMTFSDFKVIMNKLDGVYKIHFSGQGEPFMNKEIFDMIKLANDKGVLINTTTNSTFLTDRIVDNICNVEIGEIGVSIDSTKKDKFEKIREGANFEKVVENVKRLTRKLKEKEKGTIVVLAAIIMKDNLDEVVDFVKMAGDLGIDKVVFQTIQVKEDYVDKYGDEMKDEIVGGFMSEVSGRVHEAFELGKKLGVTVIFDQEASPGCLWPWRGIYITWNGYVTPCCKILNYNKPHIGNLVKQDFWDIWNGKMYQMYRLNLRKRMAPEACKGCDRV